LTVPPRRLDPFDHGLRHGHRARLPWRRRPIGDFRRWKEHDAYGKALERLLRDLKVEAS
jgi:hypothetical protein